MSSLISKRAVEKTVEVFTCLGCGYETDQLWDLQAHISILHSFTHKQAAGGYLCLYFESEEAFKSFLGPSKALDEHLTEEEEELCAWGNFSPGYNKWTGPGWYVLRSFQTISHWDEGEMVTCLEPVSRIVGRYQEKLEKIQLNLQELGELGEGS